MGTCAASPAQEMHVIPHGYLGARRDKEEEIWW
jgi:hypothetical protein